MSHPHQSYSSASGFGFGFAMAVILLTLSHSVAFGQGAAVVTPLSRTLSGSDGVIEFYIHNRLNRELPLRYQAFCEVDGIEKKAQECDATFDVNLASLAKDGLITIPTGGRIEGRVFLKNKEIRYGFFKPLFEPILESDKPGSGVQFQFKYQPGYLFLVKPSDEKISKVTFDTYIMGTTRRARFKLELFGLSMPQEISVSVKIVDKATKKLLRFVPLAKEKIADPRRGTLDLEGDFAGAENKSDVCYQLFVENRTRKDFYKVTDCP